MPPNNNTRPLPKSFRTITRLYLSAREPAMIWNHYLLDPWNLKHHCSHSHIENRSYVQYFPILLFLLQWKCTKLLWSGKPPFFFFRMKLTPKFWHSGTYLIDIFHHRELVILLKILVSEIFHFWVPLLLVCTNLLVYFKLNRFIERAYMYYRFRLFS